MHNLCNLTKYADISMVFSFANLIVELSYVITSKKVSDGNTDAEQ